MGQEEEEEGEGSLSPSILMCDGERDLHNPPSNRQCSDARKVRKNPTNDRCSRETVEYASSVLPTMQPREEHAGTIQKCLRSFASNYSITEVQERQSVLLKDLQDQAAGISRHSGCLCVRICI